MALFSPDKILLVFALEAEAQAQFSDFHTVFCGVGKVNAAYQLTSRVLEWKATNNAFPEIVINMGSAGSPVFSQGSVVNCTRFIQRDMDVSALGLERYETPFDKSPAILTNGMRYPTFAEGTCGTGDNFAVVSNQDPWSVVDMESYALAKVCHQSGIPFACLKYITDAANDDAPASWEETLPLAANALREALLSVINPE